MTIMKNYFIVFHVHVIRRNEFPRENKFTKLVKDYRHSEENKAITSAAEEVTPIRLEN